MNSKYQMSPKPVYTKVDSVFAWLSLLLAFFYCHTVPVWENPLGGFLLIFALFITAFIVLRVKEVKLHFSVILSSISALLLSFAFLLAESRFLLFLSCAYCLGSYLFLLYAALGNRVENGFSNYIYIDYIKILFILPFCSFISLFSAIASESSHKGTRFILKILIGIVMAIIPTALVFAFLSYDEGFLKILDGIFSYNPDNTLQWFMSVFFSLPLAMYGYGLYTSSRRDILKDKITAENCDKIHTKVRILPQITAVVATFPIIFLYVIFFISQWKYFISGFTGVLPAGFSYAEYARQGFFELCAVSVLNLLCIAAIAIFIGRGKKNKAVILKLLTVIFCLCTLILISTAVAKLVMYIDYYGLTQKRIYAMWLMAVIAVIFLVIALGQFISKIRIVAVSCTVFISLFIPLALCNINTITAQYNTQRYLAGSLQDMDTEMMADLGDSAIPSLVKLANTIDPEEKPELKHAIDCILFDKKVELKNEQFALFAFNLPRYFAESAIRDYDPVIPPEGSYRMVSYNFYFNEEEDLQRDYYYYQSHEVAPILTVHADRTGTLTFADKTYAVSIENCQITSEGEIFDFSYQPFDEYDEDMILTWVTEDDQSGTMCFDAVKEEEPTEDETLSAGTYAISSTGTITGGSNYYSDDTKQVLTICEDGTGSFYFKEVRYDITFEDEVLTVNGQQLPYRYIPGSENDKPMLTLYWYRDGISSIILRPVPEA